MFIRVAIITALLQGYERITLTDWEFAVAFMGWQARLRTMFTIGRAKRVTPGEFNEIVFDETLRRTKKRLTPGAKDSGNVKLIQVGEQSYVYIRWKAMSNDGRWYKYGMDVKRTVDILVNAGTLGYLMETEYDEQGKVKKSIPNEHWIKVVGAAKFLDEAQ